MDSQPASSGLPRVQSKLPTPGRSRLPAPPSIAQRNVANKTNLPSVPRVSTVASSATEETRAKSRPSLSERTIESLQSVPGTPKDRRRSSFFNPVDSPMVMPPPPRPGSSSSRNSSRNGSRPGTSDGAFVKPLASPALGARQFSASAKPASRMTSRSPSLGPRTSGNLTCRLQEAKTGVPQRSASPAKSGIVAPGSAITMSSGISKPVTTPRSLKPPSIKPTGLKTPAVKPTLAKPPAVKASVPRPTSLRPPSLKPAPSKPLSVKTSTRPNVQKVPSREESRAAPSRPTVRPAKVPAPQVVGTAQLPGQPSDDFGDPATDLPDDEHEILDQSARPSDNTPTAEPSETKRIASNSSMALRQQIAAAKAAARKAQLSQLDPLQSQTLTSNSQSVETLHDDPFNQARRDEKHILRNRVNTARMTGKLNIAAMNLKTIPDEVLKMYDSASMSESNVNWAEVVDLTRFIAADNEIEDFDDAVFPDRSAEDMADDEDSQGNQFGGLQSLDLHGNLIRSLPIGLRRLERLTSLNLANNKLDNSALDIIIQIASLKELRLGHNSFHGNLPTSICGLQSLEVLDLQHNRLLGLPEALQELTNLRVLNVSNNQLTNMPMDAMGSLPLSDLDVSSNALIGSLFPMGGHNGHSSLQHLNLANNSLAALAFSETVDMPLLETLNITNNHLTILPSIASWTRLLTLTAGDNKLSDLPHGFTSLRKLRNVNLSSNDIRILDPEVGRMEGLEVLLLAANPLRERKFLTMSAADIKRDLKSRLASEAADEDDGTSSRPDSPITVVGAEDASFFHKWSLKGNNLLDLAAQGLTDDELDTSLSEFLATSSSSDLKNLHLQYNCLTTIPASLALTTNLRSLDLSGNHLTATYLSVPLILPHLQDLNLSKCNLTSLSPLLSNLSAPHLTTLNISVNRLSGPLPQLRKAFPSLTTLFASDNKFTSLTADAIRGMNVVNLSSNELTALPPEIGLLWEEGLRGLEVGSNAFRVPGWRILEKGTEGLCRWLVGRIPGESDAGGGWVEER